jgi:hypothetical protein
MCRRASLRINAAASDSKEMGFGKMGVIAPLYPTYPRLVISIMTLNRLQLHRCQVFDSIRSGERKLSRRLILHDSAALQAV